MRTTAGVIWIVLLSSLALAQGPGGLGGNQGDGIWLRNAYFGEFQTFDRCFGHQPQSGTYHHHVQPVCLRAQLNDNLELVQTGRTGSIYREKSSGWKHSPIIGWAFDGYPIYGPYGYSDPADANSSIKRLNSGFRLRTITDRTTLPAWALAHHTGLTEALQPSQYGPAISIDYPLGRYIEDFDYIQGAGDLDVYNGRFTITPDFPNGTYAYFTTINDDGSPAFPYIMGMQYYGSVNGGNATSIPTSAQDYFANGSTSGSSTLPQVTSWYTAHASDDAKSGSGFDPSAGGRTTWPFAAPTTVQYSGGVTTATKADTQRIRFTDSSVYINAYGLASYVMGPWFIDGGNAGGVFMNWPSRQNVQVQIPLAPAAASTKRTTGLGAIGLWVNGVAIFNALDGGSWSAAAGADRGGGGVTKSSMHVSTASGESGPSAPGSLMTAFALFGANFGTSTVFAPDANWTTTLAGTSVTVRDSTGTSRNAEVFYVSPSQVGYRIPPATATGFATATINAGGATTSGSLNVVAAYPNAFQLSSDGLAQAYVTRVHNGIETTESAVRFADGTFTMAPIDLGPAGDNVYLTLYVTGLGKASMITATIAGFDAPVAFAGAEGVYPGIDLVKMRIPRELVGAGKVNVVVTADGKPSTPVYVGMK